MIGIDLPVVALTCDYRTLQCLHHIGVVLVIFATVHVTVSYTHLDVYKRQIAVHARNLAGQARADAAVGVANVTAELAALTLANHLGKCRIQLRGQAIGCLLYTSITTKP